MLLKEELHHAYRLIKLNNKIDEHKANVVDDFDLLKEYALANKKHANI